MKVLVLFPGKIKPKALAVAQEEYIKRLRHSDVDVLEYKDQRINDRNPEQTKTTEAERILKLLKPDDFLIACDERGKAIQTEELSELLRNSRHGGGALAGKRRIVIVIGGALGLAEAVRQRAGSIWSLSSLVMAGGVARLVLLEGLYRAITILEGHPYHNR